MLGQSTVDWLWQIPAMAGLGLICLALGVAIVRAPATAAAPARAAAAVADRRRSRVPLLAALLVAAIYLSDLDVRLARADRASSPQAAARHGAHGGTPQPARAAAALPAGGRARVAGPPRRTRARELLAALDREPKNFVTMALLGDLEVRAGGPDRARAWYRRALALNPIDVGLRQLAARRPACASLFLTHYFPPEVGAPQTRIAALAAGLRERGDEVTVHTGFPNYPDGRIRRRTATGPLLRERAAGRHQDRAQRGLRRAQRRLRAAAGQPHELRRLGARDRAALRARRRRRGRVAAAVRGRARRSPTRGSSARRWCSTPPTCGPTARSRSARSAGGRAVAAARALEEWAYRHCRGDHRARPRAWCGGSRQRPSAAGRAVHMPPAVDLERFAAVARRARRRRRCACSTRARSGSPTASARCVQAARLAGPGHGRGDDRGRRCGGGGARRRGSRPSVGNVELLGTVPRRRGSRAVRRGPRRRS